MMRRRHFIAGLAGAAFSFRTAARAQHPAKVPRIGILAADLPSPDYRFSRIFQSELRQLGWIEGQNV